MDDEEQWVAPDGAPYPRTAIGDILMAVAVRGEIYTVTKDGEPVAVLLPADEYDGLVEALLVHEREDKELAAAALEAARQRPLDPL